MIANYMIANIFMYLCLNNIIYVIILYCQVQYNTNYIATTIQHPHLLWNYKTIDEERWVKHKINRKERVSKCAHKFNLLESFSTKHIIPLRLRIFANIMEMICQDYSWTNHFLLSFIPMNSFPKATY